MKNQLILWVAGILLSTGLAFAQDGWKDDFNSGSLGSGWYQNSHYGLSQSEGQLKISTSKSVMWASFGVNVPQADVRSNPVVNLTIKTEEPLQVSIWLFSDAGNVILTQPVMASGGFQTVSYDFTGLDANSNVLNAVKTIGIGFNGAALSWSGNVFFDEISLGSQAVRYANVGALNDMVFFQGTNGHKIFIRGIKNTSGLQLTGAESLLENVSIDPVSTSGTTWLKFDCKAGVNSTANISLKATGMAGFTDYSVHFNLTVEGNKAPFFNPVSDIRTAAGRLTRLSLSGVNDGNEAADQQVKILISSSNEGIIPSDISVDYDGYGAYANISFTPLAPGTATLTITADDQQATSSVFQRTVTVEVLEGWNNPPIMNPVRNQEFLNNSGEQVLVLNGIGDGDSNTQNLTIAASSSDPLVIPDPVVEYTGGNTALLKLTPVSGKSGIVTINLILSDDGGKTGNNGDQNLERSFKVETYDPPLMGYAIPFTGTEPNAFPEVQSGLRDYWHVEGMGVQQVVTHEKDGTDDAMKIVCSGKSTWTGSWYYTPDMDLTNFPLISLWVKSDQNIQFHLYFWDDSIRNNEDHHLRFNIPANTWTKLEFDFSNPGGMLNNKGQLVNAKRIKRVLFNYHPSFGWPFTNWSGTVWMKDVRIGDQSGITPTYYCTIDPVGPQTVFKSNEPGKIKLTGLSRTIDKNVSVELTGTGLLTQLSVGTVVNGEADISFTPSVAGNDVLNITVNGAAISGKLPVSKQMSIPVSVVDGNLPVSGSVQVNLSQTHQVYRGFGAKDPSPSLLDQYTTEAFGATAIRFGILDGNQVETVNDNADPFVLDMSKLNRDAFDWDYVKNLRERGVETFLLTWWSPPAWMKENLSTNYQQAAALQWENTINRVMPELYDEYAENAVAAVKLFKQEAGIELAALGLQNEPAFCEPYASAILSPERFAEMIAKVGKRFEDEGINTRLYFAEQVGARMNDGPIYTNQAYLNAVNANPDAKKYSDIFAVHGYASDGISPGETPGSSDWASTFTAVNSGGKTRELWMTETEPAFTNWNDAFVNVANILTAFESGNVGLWTEWAWDGHCIDKGKPTQKLWAQSMFRHIKPGAVRVSSSSGNNDLLITSWKNDAEHGDNLVMVIMNKGNSPLMMGLEQAELPGVYARYRCSENMAAYRDGNYQKGEKLLIGARSIVTLVSGVYAMPTIDQVSNKLILLDAGTQTINLSGITDGNVESQHSIELGYTVSDPTILGGLTLNYSSPEETGIFTFSPLKAGITNVTISNTSNGVTTKMSFTVQVKDYSLPTINPVSGVLNFEKGSGTKTLDLTGISDGGDGGQVLQVSAVVFSSEPEGVIANLSVNYTSPSATGTISFTPETEGTAVIRITVTDNGPEGKNSSTTDFSVSVYGHFPPSIRQQEDTTLYTGSKATIQLRDISGGGDSDAITNIQSVSSDESVTGVVSTSFSKQWITFTPVKKGESTITVTVTDNGPESLNTTHMSFRVKVEWPAGLPDEIESRIVLYPNPAGEFLKVKMPGNSFQSYSILDMGGKIILNGELNGNEIEVSISMLSRGEYFLSLSGRDSVVVKKFIKE